MRKILFLDRDGTLIVEPPQTKQVNCLEELAFVPNVISSLKHLTQNGYQLVLVTNQDNLGTPRNPQENYDLINQKLFEILKSEGVKFLEIFTCPHAEIQNCDCRKPKIGLVQKFLLQNKIDLEKSAMIGDRKTDTQFARNIGVRGFLLGKKWNWKSIADELINAPRKAEVIRKTKETDIQIKLNLDGSGKTKIQTGLRFFDHMLEQLGKHGNFDLQIKCQGDLDIDEHHTIEDTGLSLGEAFAKALGDKIGIDRYASERIIIMDEAKSEIAIDISGRSYLVFEAEFKREYVGDFPTEMLEHFLYSFVQKSEITLHMKLAGENTHHLIEVAFKALARALRDAVTHTSNSLPSTKGTL